MKARILIILTASLLTVAGLHAQAIDNAVYVKNFPGANVGAKVTAAMATCSTNVNIPCVIVIDPSLGAWAPGSLPALCSYCVLRDYRIGGNALLPLLPQPLAITPSQLGKTETLVIHGNDDNLFYGGYGNWDDSAATKTRHAWDATYGGTAPVTGTNSLGLTGTTVSLSDDSQVVVGGRNGYYPYVAPGASVSLTYGGDNANYNLAGMLLAMHSDLLYIAGHGTHGCIYGGSFHQGSGDYECTIGGTATKNCGLETFMAGGIFNQIGNFIDCTLNQRSFILTGEFNFMTVSADGGIVAGNSNAYNSGSRSIINGGLSNTMATDDAMIAASHQALGDVSLAITQAGGDFSVVGDAQTYLIPARISFTGTSGYLSRTGGSGTDLYTPPANTSGMIDADISCARTDVQGDNCSFRLLASFTNIGGTLALTGTPVVTTLNAPSGYAVAAIIVGGGTRVGIHCTTPNSGGTTRWMASVRIVKLLSQ